MRCYCRVTYGTDAIRMKLALDNPSDYKHPDRPRPPPLCAARSAPTRVLFRVLISRVLDAGRGRQGLWVSAKEDLSDRQTGRLGKEAGGPSPAFGGNLGGCSFI